MIKLFKKNLSGFLWLLSGTALESILKILVISVLARLISPSQFGIVGVALIVIGFSKIFTQMGVGPALVQRKNLEINHIRTGFSLSILMGLFFGISLFFLSNIIADFFKMIDLVVMLKTIAFVFVFESFSLVAESLSQRNMKFKRISIISLISFVVGYGLVGITLGFLEFGAWALIWAYISQTFIKTILFLIIQKHTKKIIFDLKSLKELLYFGGGFTIAKIANYIAGQGDNIIIGKVLGDVSLGIYGRAYQFMVMPVGLFCSAMDKVLFPLLTKFQDDKKSMRDIYFKGINSIALIALPLSVIVYIIAPEIINLFLGDSWEEVILPFRILSISLLFRMSYRVSDSLARATGEVYKRANIQIIYAVIVLFMSWLGTKWGINGVALAVVISIFINFILLANLSLKLINGSWSSFINEHFKGFQLSLIIFFWTYCSVYVLRILSESSLFILSVFSVLLLLLLYFLYRYMPIKILGIRNVNLINQFLNKHNDKGVDR